MEIMKMFGLRKSSKLGRQENSEVVGEEHKKLKMLFPYEEFVKLFQYEVYDLFPRGLMNCGNSCYANFVLQCLTCTRPLTIYFLRRSHSRACPQSPSRTNVESSEFSLFQMPPSSKSFLYSHSRHR
ncbi:unnamed protein product [Camellia sinensis]